MEKIETEVTKLEVVQQQSDMKYSKVLIADLQILGAAFFFGIGFIGQRAVSMDGVGPMTCNAFRFALSTVIIIVCMPWIPSFPAEHEASDDEESDESEDENENLLDAKRTRSNSFEMMISPSKTQPPRKPESTKFILKQLFGSSYYSTYFAGAKRTVVFWGIVLGVLNFFASGFQQWGISLTSANKVAFIAGFDIVWVPIIALIVPTFKRNGAPTPSIWVAVSVSICGLYLLSGCKLGEFDMGPGETLVIISTVFWTLHITYTDIATNYVDSMHMMCVQLGVVTFLSTISSLIWEPQSWFWHHILSYLPWLLFLAVSEGLGFTLMALGQSFAPPAHAAILLSLEGVFTSLFSYFVLRETLSTRELFGCALMLAGTLLAEMGISCIDGPKKEHGGHHGGHSHPHSAHEVESGQSSYRGGGSGASLTESATNTAKSAVTNGLFSLVASISALNVMAYRYLISRPIAYFRSKPLPSSSSSSSGTIGSSSGMSLSIDKTPSGKGQKIDKGSGANLADKAAVYHSSSSSSP